jgi:phospholipid/cholesterol/gamma-HCH transport system substrate-binding protein
MRFSPEIKVGIITLISGLLLIPLTFKITGIPIWEEYRGPRITVYFESVAGLKERAPVNFVGVPVGQVSEILLENYRAKVKIVLKPGVRIPDDSVASLRTEGLLGTWYIEIHPEGKC